jgi:hypothetical protein
MHAFSITFVLSLKDETSAIFSLLMFKHCSSIIKSISSKNLLINWEVNFYCYETIHEDESSDKAKDIIEKTTPVTGSVEIGGTTLDFSSGQPAAVPFFTKYKTPLLIGGAAVAGLILFRTLKK